MNEMRDLFSSFGRVAGARLNETKTTAIDVGVWMCRGFVLRVLLKFLD